MRTEKQIEASRRNGARSRGPVTPEGKAKSSQNARRHGLLARSLALEFEDASKFYALLNEYAAQHQPEGCTEHGLVEAMATARWKQLRFDCADKIAVDLRMRTERQNPPDYPHQGAAVISTTLTHMAEGTRTMREMSLHHDRLDRAFTRALNMLLKLQDRRGFKPTPGAQSDLAPAPSPEPALNDFPEMPDDFSETNDAPELTVPEAPATEESAPSPSDFIGILPDAVCKKISQRTHPSLQTNTSPQVPLTTQPERPMAFHAAVVLSNGAMEGLQPPAF
jgi:hypothetical protein